MSEVVSFPDRSRGFVPLRLVEARAARLLSRAELGRLVGLTSQAIAYYEQGERTPDMTILFRLSDALGQPVSFFLRRGPAAPMSRGTMFFRSVGRKSDKLNAALNIKAKWLLELVEFVRSFIRLRPTDIPRPAAEAEWYELPEIEEIATATRRSWGLGDGPIANVIALLETKGAIVTRFEIEGCPVGAFSFWCTGRPYIVLGSDKRSAVRSRFDAAHELGHMILHRHVTQEELIIPDVRSRVEREANLFAGAFLLPRQSILSEFYSSRLKHFEGLKKRWRVSMQAIAHRCYEIGALDDDQYLNFRKQISAKRLLTVEPLDDEIPLEQPAYLLKACKMLIERKQIPAGGVEGETGFSLELVARLLGSLPGTLLADAVEEAPAPQLRVAD